MSGGYRLYLIAYLPKINFYLRHFSCVLKIKRFVQGTAETSKISFKKQPFCVPEFMLLCSLNTACTLVKSFTCFLFLSLLTVGQFRDHKGGWGEGFSLWAKPISVTMAAQLFTSWWSVIGHGSPFYTWGAVETIPCDVSVSRQDEAVGVSFYQRALLVIQDVLDQTARCFVNVCVFLRERIKEDHCKEIIKQISGVAV